MRLDVPDHIRAIQPYIPGKPIEETQRELGIKKVIKLASNENPLGPSPLAIAAARASLKECFRYPDSGAFSLKRALARKHGCDPRALLVSNGSNEAIDLLVRSFTSVGDSVVTSQAAFLCYRLCAQIHGVHAIETALTRDLRFDLGAILDAARENPRVKMVFVANPNNPTGTYVRGEELKQFIEAIGRIRGGSVLVCVDSAYQEYITAKDLGDPIDWMAEFPHLIVLRTFSKIYGLAGLRVGYAIAHPDVVSVVEKVRPPFNVSAQGLVAAEAALLDREFVTRSRKVNREGLKQWDVGLRKLGIPFWESQGNFLLADFGVPAQPIYQQCLKQGVIFRPVANYGFSQALRISIGTAAENQFALSVLKNAVLKDVVLGDVQYKESNRENNQKKYKRVSHGASKARSRHRH